MPTVDSQRSSITPEVGLAALQPWEFARVDGSSGDVSLDLSYITFARPAAVVALCTKAEHLVAAGADVYVIAPQSSDVSNYLCRTRLPATLNMIGARHNFGTVNERAQGYSLVELAPFSDADSVSSLADSVHSFASTYSQEIASALHTAVCEAGENVGFHSGMDHGYLMAQYFPGMGTFEFALGDSGKGFYESLKAAGATSAHHAIELAATRGVSSTGDSTRGIGIAAIREHVTNLGGQLGLAADEAFQTFSPAVPNGQVRPFAGRIVGSLVSGQIDTRRRFR
ncbi:ATP-binding protein [Homoserinimonas sp. A520]